MVNLEKVQLGRQENASDSLELLGLLDHVENEYLSTRRETVSHRHSLKDDRRTRHKTQARRKLLITSLVCFIFMIGEIIGGYVAQSLAIMTDAAHLLADLCSVLLSLFSLWISSRPSSKHLTFGWHRSEVLGALLSVLSIWAMTVILVLLAVQRIISDDYDIHSDVMLITAGCAVVLNIILVLILHQSHGHSDGLTAEHGNTSVRAVFIHTVGDLLQSFGVLLAAIIIYFQPKWKIADPVCTFLFSLFVLGTTFTILKDIINTLMEGVPPGVDIQSISDHMSSIQGVKSTHDLHVWSLSSSEAQFTVHAVIDEQSDPQTVLMDMTKLLRSKYGFDNITIQTETYRDETSYCSLYQDTTE